MRRVLAPVMLLSLLGCGNTFGHDPSGELGVCPAPAFQDFVGQPYAHTLFDWPNLRIIRPGDAATMDARPDRLNIDLDDSETITRIWCG